MKYRWFQKICANWSSTEKSSYWSTQYPVVRYTEYAPSIEEFIAKYPHTTIEQCSEARSPETFGDIGTGCHPFEFETRHFNNDKYYNKQIVGTTSNHFTFDVGVEVGVGLKKDGLMLYIRPYTNGWIYSVGSSSRCLQFGLSVTKVTFQSQSYEDQVEFVLKNRENKWNVSNKAGKKMFSFGDRIRYNL